MKTLNQISSALNLCDIADFEGHSLTWFLDGAESELTFTNEHEEIRITATNEQFVQVVDNTITFKDVDGVEVSLDLYTIQAAVIK